MNDTVLFTQRVEVVESYGERRDSADQRIADFILECGFFPVPVPNKKEMAERMFAKLSPVGIVLTGGNSLVKYGGNAPERDATDDKLIEMAICNRTPVYGFCRGMQSILDYFGNNLIQVEGHVATRHTIHGIEKETDVNSYHSQGSEERTLKGLDVIMRAEDGVIEKVRHRELPIIGTMWHPEREESFRKYDVVMVRELFGGSKK